MKRFLFIILTALLACAASQAATRKVVYVVMDGIPADYIERVHPATVFDVARHGGYARASTGGEIGGYSQTPTISAVGYMNILTGTWLNKHNVPGNSNLDPNYNYWSLFRIAKQQPAGRITVRYSSEPGNPRPTTSRSTSFVTVTSLRARPCGGLTAVRMSLPSIRSCAARLRSAYAPLRPILVGSICGCR